MANTLVTPSWTAKEVSRYYENSLKAVAHFDRQYDDQFIIDGAHVGNTIKIRLPQMFEVSTGDAYDEQALYDQTVNLVLNAKHGVHFSYSALEATTDLDSIRERYIMPAAETLANKVDSAALANVTPDVYNFVGTFGTTPSAYLTLIQAGVKLTDFGAPVDGRVAILDPLAMGTIANATAALFHPARTISDNNKMGEMSGVQWGLDLLGCDPNLMKHTTGSCAAASTPLVNGAGQTGSSIVTDGWGAASAPVAGDIVTFAGVYAVNPISKISTGRLQQFVLTATPTAGTGPTLTISPSITTSGALQNVSAGPADNATVTYLNMAAGGTQAATVSPQSLVFVKNAFALGYADLARPVAGAESSFVRSKQNGLSLRLVRQYDAKSDKNLNRIDVLFGSACVRPEWAVRLVG